MEKPVTPGKNQPWQRPFNSVKLFHVVHNTFSAESKAGSICAVITEDLCFLRHANHNIKLHSDYLLLFLLKLMSCETDLGKVGKSFKKKKINPNQYLGKQQKNKCSWRTKHYYTHQECSLQSKPEAAYKKLYFTVNIDFSIIRPG